jgi:predicted nucleotidyltransferase
MSTSETHNSLGAALFGKTRRALLALFYGHPERAFYLREVVRTAGVGQGAVQRELAQLTAVGLLTRHRRGNQVYYQANPEAPIFAELRSLVVKTAGMAEVLREALAELAGRVTVAFVHGSLARGLDQADSDVDLVVVGDLSFGDVVAALHPAQDRLQRELNPTVYSPAEFREKLQEGHHFLTAIMTTPKIFLVGGEHELAGLGAKRLAH